MRKRRTSSQEIVHLLGLFVIIAILVFSTTFALPVGRAATQVQVENSGIFPQQSFVNLPSGAQIYLYGYNVGSSLQSGLFVNGQYFYVRNAIGNIVDSLAVTTNNSNVFLTPCGALTIVGISGFSSYTFTYGISTVSGAGFASDTFHVTSTGQLAVIFAFGGSQSIVRDSGIPGMQIDASNVNSDGWVTSGLMPMTGGHSYLNKGRFTVSEVSEGNITQNTTANKTHMTDLIGVFLFTPGILSTRSNQTPTTALGFFQVLEVMIIVAVIAVVSLATGVIIGTYIGKRTRPDNK